MSVEGDKSSSKTINTTVFWGGEKTPHDCAHLQNIHGIQHIVILLRMVTRQRELKEFTDPMLLLLSLFSDNNNNRRSFTGAHLFQYFFAGYKAAYKSKCLRILPNFTWLKLLIFSLAAIFVSSTRVLDPHIHSLKNYGDSFTDDRKKSRTQLSYEMISICSV